MAEESDLERTESASPRRLEQAKEEGSLARSRELSTFTLLISAGLFLWWMGPGLVVSVSGMIRDSLQFEPALAFDSDLMLQSFYRRTVDMLIAFLPLLLVLLVAALTGPLLLNGWVFSWKPLQPDFQRLNPVEGFSRLFALQGLAELAKALVKTVLIGGVAAWVIWHHKDEVLALAGLPLDSGIAYLGRLTGSSFLTIAGAIVVIAAIDVPFQVWDFRRKLKMTREELRQEAKETEGDPQIKARIRSQQREIARRRMMAEIPKADVIITNPVHYAVALRYQDAAMRAPKVVAKGAHLLASRIRELGEEYRVPILEAPPLARALYHHTELGDEIPEALYTAVAEVLAYVFQLRRYREYGGVPPRLPQALYVPPGLDPQSAEKNNGIN